MVRAGVFLDELGGEVCSVLSKGGIWINGIREGRL